MTRGPKPKGYLRLVAPGTGKRRLRREELAPLKGGLPTPPPELSTEARAEWRRVAPQLHELGLLIHLDRALLAAYCAAFARWRLAERTLAEMTERDPPAGALIIKTISGNAIQNPLLGVANKAARDMASFAAELGLTPISRIRLQLKAPLPDNDPAARFLR